MSIGARCSSCGRKFTAKVELLGKRVKCPACGRPVVVTTAPAAETKSEPEAQGGSTPDSRSATKTAQRRTADIERSNRRWRLIVGIFAGAPLLLGFFGAVMFFFSAERGPVVVRRTQFVVLDRGSHLEFTLGSEPGRTQILVVELRNSYPFEKFTNLARDQIYLDVSGKRFAGPISRATARSDGTQLIVLCFTVPADTRSAMLHLGDDPPIPLTIKGRIREMLDVR